jgi:hypothetical protein
VQPDRVGSTGSGQKAGIAPKFRTQHTATGKTTVPPLNKLYGKRSNAWTNWLHFNFAFLSSALSQIKEDPKETLREVVGNVAEGHTQSATMFKILNNLDGVYYAPADDFLDLALDLRRHLPARNLLEEALLACAEVVDKVLLPRRDVLYRYLVEHAVDTG